MGADDFYKDLVELLAEAVHDVWWEECKRQDRVHPYMIPYEELDEDKKEYDRKTVLAVLKKLTSEGYMILQEL